MAFYALKEYQQIGRQIRMLVPTTLSKMPPKGVPTGAILTVAFYEKRRNLIHTEGTDQYPALVVFGWTEGRAWELC